MPLRTKTLVIIGITVVTLSLTLYITSRAIVLSAFDRLEQQFVWQQVEQATSTLSDEIDALDTTTSDWAAWDDTYAFIEDGNQDYVRSNLVDGTFISVRLNLVLFVDGAGRIVFGKGFDPYTAKEIPLPQGIQAHLTRETLLNHPDASSALTGFILLPDGPMLVASRPILTSEEGGPARGTLIMGRYLDDREIRRLANIARLSLTVCRLDEQQMPPDFETARVSLTEEAPTFAQPLNPDSIAGYTILKDVYGRPILLLRVDMPRDIHAHGRATVSYFVVALLVASSLLGFVSFLLMERAVLSRLARLNTEISNIGTRGNPLARVSVTGRDELTGVADAINVTLEALQQTEGELQHLLDLEGLITDLAIYLVNLPPAEIGDGITYALQAIGELIGAERGRVLLFSDEGSQLNYGPEWRLAGIDDEDARASKSVLIPQSSWWMGKLRWFETMLLPRCADLPAHAREERDIWLPPATHSAIIVPMVHSGTLIGALGFTSEHRERHWHEAETNLLRTAAGLLATALEQKQAEELLRRSERRFRDIARTTGDWIWEIDAEGRYTYANPVVERTLGYAPAQIMGRYYHDFFHPRDRERLEKCMQKASRRKEPFIGITGTALHADGHSVVLEFTGLPLLDKEGHLRGYRGVHRDISDQHRLENSLAAIHMLGQGLVLSRDRQQIAQTAASAIRLLLQCRRCGLWLVDETEKRLANLTHIVRGRAVQTGSVSLGDEHNIVAAVVQSGEPIYVPDMRQEPRYVAKSDEEMEGSGDTDADSRSHLCVPLRIGEHVIGALNAESETADAWGEDEVRLLSALADRAALAIENAHLYGAVTEQREQLRALARRLAEASESESQRLARELHDQVGQNLTALGINLNIVRTQVLQSKVADLVGPRLADSLTLVEQTAERIRGVMTDLRPPVLDDYGLLAALQWYGTQFARRTGIAVAVQGKEINPRLPALVENTLFRITQEALNNIARHAQASQVNITVGTTDTLARLVIADDGVGFELAQVRGPDGHQSWGLLSMAERAEAVGGQCRVESRPQQGTRVIAEVPR